MAIEAVIALGWTGGGTEAGELIGVGLAGVWRIGLVGGFVAGGIAGLAFVILRRVAQRIVKRALIRSIFTGTAARAANTVARRLKSPQQEMLTSF